MKSTKSKQIQVCMVLENLKLMTWFGCICAKKGFRAKENISLCLELKILFEVLESINDNAYKIDLGDKHDVSATLYIGDLAPYLKDEELRTTPFEEEEDDVKSVQP